MIKVDYRREAEERQISEPGRHLEYAKVCEHRAAVAPTLDFEIERFSG